MQTSDAEATPAVRAVPLPTGSTVHLDGRLDEPFWKDAEPITRFLMQEPREGGEPTERTMSASCTIGTTSTSGRCSMTTTADRRTSSRRTRTDSSATMTLGNRARRLRIVVLLARARVHYALDDPLRGQSFVEAAIEPSRIRLPLVTFSKTSSISSMRMSFRPIGRCRRRKGSGRSFGRFGRSAIRCPRRRSIVSGRIVREMPGTLSIRNENEGRTVLRAAIPRLRAASRSIMPDDYRRRLSAGELSDVIAFLQGGTGR